MFVSAVALLRQAERWHWQRQSWLIASTIAVRLAASICHICLPSLLLLQLPLPPQTPRSASNHCSMRLKLLDCLGVVALVFALPLPAEPTAWRSASSRHCADQGTARLQLLRRLCRHDAGEGRSGSELLVR